MKLILRSSPKDPGRTDIKYFILKCRPQYIRLVIRSFVSCEVYNSHLTYVLAVAIVQRQALIACVDAYRHIYPKLLQETGLEPLSFRRKYILDSRSCTNFAMVSRRVT